MKMSHQMFVGVPKIWLDSWTHMVKHYNYLQLYHIGLHVNVTPKVQMSSSSAENVVYTENSIADK